MSVTNPNKLKDTKPRAWAKIQEFPQKMANKESVALVQLQYRYDCNFKCKHCAIERFSTKKTPLLSVDNVKNIAGQLDAMGIASICISGGEPLIFPDLKEVISAIGPERFVISMDTNGWLLNGQKVKWLVDNGVNRIHISIDGLKRNHDSFREKEGSWDRCIKALEYCKIYGLGVVINIVVTKSLINSGELIRQLEYLHSSGEHASLIYAKPTGTFEGNQEEILDSQDIEYLDTLPAIYNVSTHLSPNCGISWGCLCFKRHFSITAYGDVLPCPWIPITMGNVLKEDLQKIVNRGLKNEWFAYGNKYSCQSGDKGTYFYKYILSQIKYFKAYPVDYKLINWKGEK